jgi:hypothetical protein
MHKAEYVLRTACMQDAITCESKIHQEASASELHIVAVPRHALPLPIKTYLEEEHMQSLLDISGNGNAFIRTLIPTKEMWDGVRSEHIKTLSCSFVFETSSKRANVQFIFRDIMEEVMKSGPVTLPLHLRIAAWHDDQMRSGSATCLDICEIKTVQASLQRLDPSGELTVSSVRTRLEPLVRQYEKLILHDRVETGMSLKDALKIYNYFHQLRRTPSWGDICVCCTCRVCFANGVCKD